MPYRRSGGGFAKIAGATRVPSSFFCRNKGWERRAKESERRRSMNTVVKIEPKDIDAVPFQDASLDIWDKKYRLTAKDGTPIDKTMDDTYQRVARARAGGSLRGVWWSGDAQS